MKTVRLKPPAKINLGLRVLGRRKDGYHTLSTVFCAVSLHDDLWIRKGKTLNVKILGRRIKRPDLVERGARGLAQLCGIKMGAAITLRKTIPLGGGLGGGSSDAAAVLRGLVRFWGLRPNQASLGALARDLGADVPFFLGGGLAVARGRGDLIRPLPGPKMRRWFVLVLDTKPLPTPEVFKAYDSMKRGRYNTRDQRPFRNDLSAAAEKLRPALRTRREALESVWKKSVAMSGSGPTLFAEFPDEGEARKAVRKASRMGFKYLRMVHSLSRGESLRILTGRS